MKVKYQIICMAFDGEYKRESPEFDEIDKAWEYANNLGSKWYFYPFYFVVKNQTIVDSASPLENLNGKRIKTVQKIFNKASKEDDAQGMDAERFAFMIHCLII